MRMSRFAEIGLAPMPAKVYEIAEKKDKALRAEFDRKFWKIEEQECKMLKVIKPAMSRSFVS